MNIFYVDKDPVIAAQSLCDKHVVKMILESAQMLSTAHNLKSDTPGPYKSTHKNHPSAIWCRSGYGQYAWLVTHFKYLLEEYTHRYGKIHKCQQYLDFFANYPLYINDITFTQPPQCMPDEYKHPDTVTAYRNYYKHGKAHLLKYTKRERPEWLNA